MGKCCSSDKDDMVLDWSKQDMGGLSAFQGRAPGGGIAGSVSDTMKLSGQYFWNQNWIFSVTPQFLHGYNKLMLVLEFPAETNDGEFLVVTPQGDMRVNLEGNSMPDSVNTSDRRISPSIRAPALPTGNVPLEWGRWRFQVLDSFIRVTNKMVADNNKNLTIYNLRCRLFTPRTESGLIVWGEQDADEGSVKSDARGSVANRPPGQADFGTAGPVSLASVPAAPGMVDKIVNGIVERDRNAKTTRPGAKPGFMGGMSFVTGGGSQGGSSDSNDNDGSSIQSSAETADSAARRRQIEARNRAKAEGITVAKRFKVKSNGDDSDSDRASSSKNKKSKNDKKKGGDSKGGERGRSASGNNNILMDFNIHDGFRNPATLDPVTGGPNRPRGETPSVWDAKNHSSQAVSALQKPKKGVDSKKADPETSNKYRFHDDASDRQSSEFVPPEGSTGSRSSIDSGSDLNSTNSSEHAALNNKNNKNNSKNNNNNNNSKKPQQSNSSANNKNNLIKGSKDKDSAKNSKSSHNNNSSNNNKKPPSTATSLLDKFAREASAKNPALAHQLKIGHTGHSDQGSTGSGTTHSGSHRRRGSTGSSYSNSSYSNSNTDYSSRASPPPKAPPKVDQQQLNKARQTNPGIVVATPMGSSGSGSENGSWTESQSRTSRSSRASSDGGSSVRGRGAAPRPAGPTSGALAQLPALEKLLKAQNDTLPTTSTHRRGSKDPPPPASGSTTSTTSASSRAKTSTTTSSTTNTKSSATTASSSKADLETSNKFLKLLLQQQGRSAAPASSTPAAPAAAAPPTTITCKDCKASLTVDEVQTHVCPKAPLPPVVDESPAVDPGNDLENPALAALLRRLGVGGAGGGGGSSAAPASSAAAPAPAPAKAKAKGKAPPAAPASIKSEYEPAREYPGDDDHLYKNGAAAGAGAKTRERAASVGTGSSFSGSFSSESADDTLPRPRAAPVKAKAKAAARPPALVDESFSSGSGHSSWSESTVGGDYPDPPKAKAAAPNSNKAPPAPVRSAPAPPPADEDPGDRVLREARELRLRKNQALGLVDALKSPQNPPMSAAVSTTASAFPVQDVEADEVVDDTASEDTANTGNEEARWRSAQQARAAKAKSPSRTPADDKRKPRKTLTDQFLDSDHRTPQAAAARVDSGRNAAGQALPPLGTPSAARQKAAPETRQEKEDRVMREAMALRGKAAKGAAPAPAKANTPLADSSGSPNSSLASSGTVNSAFTDDEGSPPPKAPPPAPKGKAKSKAAAAPAAPAKAKASSAKAAPRIEAAKVLSTSPPASDYSETCDYTDTDLSDTV